MLRLALLRPSRRGISHSLALAATLLPCAAFAAHRKPAAHAAPAPSRAHAVAATRSSARAAAPVRATRGKAARHAEAVHVEVAETRHHGSSKALSPREALAAKAAAFREPPAVHLGTDRHTKPAPAEATADSATQDRVHAWMKARGSATVQDFDQAAAAPAVAADDIKPGKQAAPKKQKAAVAPQPDLSTSPRKATVADFDRAVQQQTQTLHAVAVQNQARTTADDDAAAYAESKIPSTAPTARVALPFTHGELLGSATTHGELLGSATSADFNAKAAEVASQPPTLSTKTVDDAALRKPDARPDATVLANTASAGDASPRAIAAQAAAAPAPKLQLQKPAPVTRQAPAATAVTLAAKHPKLDPAVTAAMTDETFDDDDAVPTAATAIALSAKVAKADPIAKPALTPLVDEDEVLRGSSAAVKVNLYDANGRLRLIPPMKGSHEILVHQNQMAVSDGLDRIEDDDQLYDMRRLKLLVALPDNDAIAVNESLPADRRYARPWTVRFLNDLARAHYARFHTPLTITSAVRTVAFQKRLVRINGNAAPPTGDIASPHLYGQAVDLGKHGMSVTEIAWMRAYLTPVESEGKIDVEEEFQQACFHISVYRRYLGVPARKHMPEPEDAPARVLQQVKTVTPAPAKRRRHLGALLATGLR